MQRKEREAQRALPDIFAIVDTETTGMRPAFSRVIDIGIIRVEHGVVTDRFETLINPGTPLSPMTAQISGITEDDIVDAPPFEDVALSIKELLDGAVFVAHNASFDYAFLKAEFRRIGINFSAPTLCTVALSRKLFPNVRGHSLDKVMERHGIMCDNRHRAMPDAEVVYTFLRKLETNHDMLELREAVQKIIGNSKTFERKSLGELHDGAGVYFFYGPERELLYVGKSKHVRTRARSHFSDKKTYREIRMTGQTESVETISTPGELSALLLESQLIKQENPLYNRALRRKRSLVTATVLADKNGYHHIVLSRTQALEKTAGIEAVFRTVTQARATFRAMAKEYYLCQKLLGTESAATNSPCFGYHIGSCNGACIEKEPAQIYNERLRSAFSKRRLRTWPYHGAVMIDERQDESSGAVFIIDNWCLVQSFRYDGEMREPFLFAENTFDYDTYKILTRYLLDWKNARTIRVLNKQELRTVLAEDDTSVHEFSYEPIIA